MNVHKLGAVRLGMAYEQYVHRIANGQKWCTQCKAWRDRAEFFRDRSRNDGIAASCKRHKYARTKRDPMKERARHAVFGELRAKRVPHPNALPCKDCGHGWSEGERRHEYDHYLGYEPHNHLKVEAVCTVCHAERELARGSDYAAFCNVVELGKVGR